MTTELASKYEALNNASRAREGWIGPDGAADGDPFIIFFRGVTVQS